MRAGILAMAIVETTGHDSSVIGKGIGLKGRARRSPRNDKQGEFLRAGNERFSSTAWPSGPKSGPRKLHSATSLRMTTAQGAKNTSLGWEKANKHVRVGIEARSGSKKLMTMIDKETARICRTCVHSSRKLGGGIPQES